MKAGLRLKMVFFAGVLLASAVPAFGQAVPDASSNTPATDAVGPRELQNFSLSGTTTKVPEQPANSMTAVSPVAQETVRAETRSKEPTARPARPEPIPKAVGQTTLKSTAPAKTTEAGPPEALSPVAAPQTSATAPLPSPSFNPPAGPPMGSTADRRLPILPWIIAAFVLAGGAIFLLWRRNHQREAIVAGADHDLFVPASTVPAPAPTPRTPKPEPASRAPSPELAPPIAPRRPSGIVASRLRPSLELAVQPLRCLVDDEQVTIEFEVELFNSGTAPARAVIAEASLFNASASQEQELAAFYARPPGAGDRIDSIPPMRRMSFINRVVAPRAQVQEYELGGRKSFVPVLAFNALYEWSGGKGQSSLAYLLGRETRGEKLGPLHLDGGGHELRGLGARVLPTAVRT